MLNHVAITGNGSCKTPVDENLALGQSLNISAHAGGVLHRRHPHPGAADIATLERKLASLKK